MILMRNLAGLGLTIVAMIAMPAIAVHDLAIAQEIVPKPANNDNLRTQEITEAVYLKQSGYDRLQKADIQGAIADLQKALALFQKWQATGGERDTLNFLGEVYLVTGQYAQAMPYFEKALKIAKTIAKVNNDPNNDPDVAYTLQYIADVYDKQRQYPAALQVYQEALTIFRGLLKAQKGDRQSLLVSESVVLSRLAAIYFKASKYDLALATYQQMIPNADERSDLIGKVQILNNSGVIYANQTEYVKALAAYERALTLVRSLCCYRGDEAAILNNISSLYFSLGQNRRALEVADQATKIYLRLSTEKFAGLKKTEIELLHDILGEDNSNPTLTSRGLSVRATVGDTANNDVVVKAGQANNLTNLAHLYSNSGKYNEAIAFFQKARSIYQEIGNDLGLGITTDNIGSTYARLGQFEQAISFHQQALTQYEKVRDRAGTGVALSNLGRAYANLGNRNAAISNYQQALKITREVSDRSTEAVVLANIGEILVQAQQIEAAIAYLKQSVNVRETIRQSIRMLPREDRSAYKQSVSYTYRTLAKMLLEQGRVIEALQILDLLKVQELQDYLRDVKGSDRTSLGITLFAPEQAVINADVLSLSQNSAMSAQIRQIATQQAANLATSRSLLTNLQKFGDRAALFYPLLFEDQLFLVVVPAKSAPILKSIKIKSAEFTALMRDFRADLQDAGSNDVENSSYRLYKYLIEPIAAELAKAQIELILYAPDGQMRYIPLAALYDGKQWLVQRYRFNYLTALGLLDMPPPKSSQQLSTNQPKAIAAAFTQGQIQFAIGSEKFTFTGLPFAGLEIETVAKIFPNTTKLLDNLFDRKTAISEFENYNLIHLATHAAFLNGTPEDSFVLMGNGDRLNLRELREWRLPNTQLIVLSACQTAVGGVLSSGEEILGFGYQIQRTGAKAAIASLWTVSDQGTSLLMDSFYSQLQKGTDIINSLRQAQIALISRPDNFQHPYFWSGFILVGNGSH